MQRKEKETNKEYVLRIIEEHPFAIDLDEIRATMSRQRKNRNLVDKNSGSLGVTLSTLLKEGEIKNVGSDRPYKYQIVRQEATEEETENEPEEKVEVSPIGMFLGVRNHTAHLTNTIDEMVRHQYNRNQELKNRLIQFLEGRASLLAVVSVVDSLDADSAHFNGHGETSNE